ncbi:MAG: alpha/beta fold hydrolase [Acidimicrobiales bacterium]
MPTAAVNGAHLFYEEVGKGPTCLVAHGWLGSDHTYLRPGLDLLHRHLRLVYYDHRAHGRSGGGGSGLLTVEQLADDAVALGAHLGPGPVLLLGHHHGAAVAQEAAIRHPGQVSGLVLVGGSPGELGKHESLADLLDTPPVPPEVEVVQRVPPGTDEEWAATMHALAGFFFHRVGTAEREAPFARAVCRAEAAAAAMMSLGWWSCVDRLSSAPAPALVLVGRHDVFHPPYQSERIARHLPGATLRVLDDCAHLPWVEAPDAVVEAVTGWLPTVRP